MRFLRSIFLGLLVPIMFMGNSITAEAETGDSGVDVGAQDGTVKGTFYYRNADVQDGNGGRRPADNGGGSTGPRRVSSDDASDEVIDAVFEECLRQFGPVQCSTVSRVPDMVSMGPSLQLIATRLVAELRLPDPSPRFGPDPSVNEWKMLTVGYPIWLWTEGPRTVSTSVSANGVTFRLAARWRSTDFTMGDGHTVSCSAMTPYTSRVKPAEPSPTCGYVYEKPSLPQGSYTVSTRTNWVVTWSAAGYQGTLPASHQGSRSLPIGELQALNR